jgi:flagellar hook protein FlgE
MANALLIGVSGLESHQKMLDVIGNNLANLNSTAYKAQRVEFSDLLYENLSAATSGSPGVLGGINPSQIGSGTQIAQVSSNFTQGNLEATGQQLDFAIDGAGFFVMSDGGIPKYTRAGSFGVDPSGILVDPATGFRVQRTGDAGEPNGVDPAFQTAGDNDIKIPFGTIIPGQTTGSVALTGNLSSDAVGPAAGELQTNAPFTTGGGTAVTSSTLLNDLDSNQTQYVAGDSILLTGTDVDGTPVSASFNVGPTTTVGDLIAAINTNYPQATASLKADGTLDVTSNTTGASFLSMQIRDASTNTGGTKFDDHVMVVTQAGRDGTTVLGGFQVFDSLGKSHAVSTKLQKQADGSWSMTATMDSADGTITDGQIDNIRFKDDGSFLQGGGAGASDSNLIFRFTGITQPQTISVSMGTQGSYDGLTQLSASSSMAAKQDGFGAGTLVSLTVNSDGLLQGVASNGRTVELAQLAIASFKNPEGLTRAGNNYFAASAASGDPDSGTALSGGRGSVKSNYLETSNVDIAQEFTRLIIAQRGFSANARTITVADQVLQELTQLIR